MNLFFELLQVSLGTRETLSRVPTDAEWGSLLEDAKGQFIVGLLFDGIERLPANQRPPEEKDELLYWIGWTQMAEMDAQRNLDRAVELSSLVRQAGYDSCVLKGAAVARYYPHFFRREYNDIDLWVKSDRKGFMSWLCDNYTITHNVWHNVGVEIFEDVPVEIHFHPGWLWNPWHNRRLQCWFDNFWTKAEKDEKLGLSVMPIEFDAVFSLVHTFRHLVAEGICIKQYIDYFFILKQVNAEGLELRVKTFNVICDLGLEKFTSAIMWVFHKVFGMSSEELLCEPDEKEGRFLMQQVMSSGEPEDNEESKSDLKKSLVRRKLMIRHYPNEVRWMIPWKIWHWCWRKLYAVR